MDPFEIELNAPPPRDPVAVALPAGIRLVQRPIDAVIVTPTREPVDRRDVALLHASRDGVHLVSQAVGEEGVRFRLADAERELATWTGPGRPFEVLPSAERWFLVGSEAVEVRTRDGAPLARIALPCGPLPGAVLADDGSVRGPCARGGGAWSVSPAGVPGDGTATVALADGARLALAADGSAVATGPRGSWTLRRAPGPCGPRRTAGACWSVTPSSTRRPAGCSSRVRSRAGARTAIWCRAAATTRGSIPGPGSPAPAPGATPAASTAVSGRSGRTTGGSPPPTASRCSSGTWTGARRSRGSRPRGPRAGRAPRSSSTAATAARRGSRARPRRGGPGRRSGRCRWVTAERWCT